MTLDDIDLIRKQADDGIASIKKIYDSYSLKERETHSDFFRTHINHYKKMYEIVEFELAIRGF